MRHAMRHAQAVGAMWPAPRFGHGRPVAPDHRGGQFGTRRFDIVEEGGDGGRIDTGRRRRAAGEAVVVDWQGDGYRSGHGKFLFVSGRSPSTAMMLFA